MIDTQSVARAGKPADVLWRKINSNAPTPLLQGEPATAGTVGAAVLEITVVWNNVDVSVGIEVEGGTVVCTWTVGAFDGCEVG